MTRLIRSSAARSSTQLLARILERADLVAVVDKLSAPVLGRLIAHVGLEDAGELVAVASTEQLERVWDRDLWQRDEQGGPERFDPERFALWLSVMLEAGEAETVARLRELPFDLLTLAVHRLVRVVERSVFLARAEHETEEEEAEGGPHVPWQELILVARDEQAWDALLRVLLALDEEDHALVRRVLERCLDLDDQLSQLQLEPDEMYTALTGAAALESDVAAERDDRQGLAGYLSAADAQSFLRAARSGPPGRASQLNRDPIAHAYFRELAAAGTADPSSDATRAAPAEREQAGQQAALAALLGLLAESGVVAEGSAPIATLAAYATPADTLAELEPRAAPAAADQTLLQAALQLLEREQPALWSQRMEELSFLANAVQASGQDGGHAFEPRAALEACTALCSLGLELELPRHKRTSLPTACETLAAISADLLFRAGAAQAWSELTAPARDELLERCARWVAPRLPELREAVEGDELGDWPEELDAELLRLPAAQLDALRGLAEGIPRLSGVLAGAEARYLTTELQLQEGKRLLHALGSE